MLKKITTVILMVLFSFGVSAQMPAEPPHGNKGELKARKSEIEMPVEPPHEGASSPQNTPKSDALSSTVTPTPTTMKKKSAVKATGKRKMLPATMKKGQAARKEMLPPEPKH
jgi:hypothetical protein